MPTLLVVDDEPAIRHALRRAFRDSDLELRESDSAADALTAIRNSSPDVVVLDIHLPDSSGLEAFRKIRTIDTRVPVILITGHGTTDLAIEAMKEGAFEYLLKPLELSVLRELIDRAVRSSRRMTLAAALPEEEAPAGSDRLVGRCPPMQEVYKAIGRVAGQDVTVLLTGETGTGKELVARAIYQHSARSGEPFVAINCGAIPETLIESELFGHEKGAFSGADRRRIGRFEQANRGTIFLDEISEMTPLAQVKMLRVLQERVLERVGGDETIPVDVRVIAATNSDLSALVGNGSFRHDLFFRLNVFRIALPPLCDRGNDLELLTDYFLRRFADELGRTFQNVSPEARAVLKAYPWPGNVRELQSVLKQAVLHMGGPVLLVDDLPRTLLAPPRTQVLDSQWDAFVKSRIATGSTSLYAEATELMDREVLVRVLKHTNGNQLQAAKILGITRGSLRTKIRVLGIAIKSEIDPMYDGDSN